MRIQWMPLAVAALFGLSADAHAQQTTAADVTTELRLIATQPTAADADRATLRVFLDRADVDQVAQAHGVDLEALKDRVSTVSDAEAAELAERVGAMAGGDTIVISASAVIIALLVLILLSVD